LNSVPLPPVIIYPQGGWDMYPDVHRGWKVIQTVREEARNDNHSSIDIVAIDVVVVPQFVW
jgi:hypothetical protein